MIPLLIGLFAGLFHYSAMTVEQFEIRAADEIASKLQGDRKKVTVRTGLDTRALSGDIREVRISATHFQTEGLPLFTEPQLSKRGKVRKLNLELTDFSLGGLRVEKLQAIIPDCRFDLGLATRKHKIRLSQSGTGDGTVTIKAADLESFILKKFREIKRVKVTISPSKLQVEGYGEFIVVAANFSVVAKLEAKDGTQLRLSEANITMDGKTADPETSKLLLETLNPVVDLDKDLHLFGAVHVDKVTLGDGELVVGGKTQIPIKPKE